MSFCIIKFESEEELEYFVNKVNSRNEFLQCKMEMKCFNDVQKIYIEHVLYQSKEEKGVQNA